METDEGDTEGTMAMAKVPAVFCSMNCVYWG